MRPAPAKFFLASLALLVSTQPGFCFKVVPSATYEYTTGSDSYGSHSGSGAIAFKFKRYRRLTAAYNLFTDNDYSLFQSGILRGKAPVSRNVDGSAAVILGQGDVKDSPSRVSTFSLDFQGTRYLKRRFEFTGGYRYTHGSVSEGTVRELSSGPGLTVLEVQPGADYALHTLSAELGYQNRQFLKGMFTAARVAATANTESAPTYSQSLETFCPLVRGFYLGLAFTLTQTPSVADRNYLSFSLSKYF